MRRSPSCSSHVGPATSRIRGRWTADSGTSWAAVAAAMLLLTGHTLGLAAASTSDEADTLAQRNGAPCSVGCSDVVQLDIFPHFITQMARTRSSAECASFLLACVIRYLSRRRVPSIQCVRQKHVRHACTFVNANKSPNLDYHVFKKACIHAVLVNGVQSSHRACNTCMHQASLVALRTSSRVLMSEHTQLGLFLSYI